MPRIDPMKLLVCLSVLLAPNGGILAAAEVKRLANLMAKFSKKLVSKCIYIQILKCTETDLLGQFMQTGGWSLVHMWLVDGIGSKNWPLIQELLELLLCCPVDVERLKINSTPRLVKSLSTDSAHERVRVLASKLVEQWLFIVKAPKHSSPMVPLATATSDAAAITTGGVTVTQHTNVPAIAAGSTAAFGEANHSVRVTGSEATGRDGSHMYNGSAEGGSVANLAVDDEKERSMKIRKREDDIDSAKKTFRALVEQEPHKKTSLVLKITTKNGKQVVAKVVSPGSKKLKQGTDGTIHGNGTEDEDDQDEDDEEEVVVNIESEKHHSDDTVPEAKQLKKHEHHEHAREGKERSGSISSASSKDRHHSRDREKERKGSSSGSGGRSSSSKNSGSSGSTGNHNSSSSKHKSGSSSSRSGSSSSSRDKERDRHGGSSSSSSKHKSSSSSSSKSSSSSGSKSSGGSDKHRDHKDRSSHSGGTSGRDNKDSKGQSLSPSSSSSSKVAKLSRKSSKDDVNDSGSESGSASGGAGAKSGSGASNVPGGHKKAASISIEVRNPENRPKTVKTYNSQFRSHGLIEEAPPPPSRKGLKKPSTSTASSPSAAAAATVGAGSAGATNTAKRLSPPPSLSPSPSSSSNGGSMEKRIREDPVDRPGAIKLIAAPKRQHALVESDMFMDALSATLRKDIKKRKRRTSGSESTGSSTPVVVPVGKASESGKPCDSSPTKTTVAPESPTTATAPAGTATVSEAKPEVTPAAPTSPVPKAIPPPIVAPMSFYRDTLAEDDETSPKDGDLKQEQDSEEVTAAAASGAASADVTAESDAMEVDEDEDNEEEEQVIIPKSKRMKMTLKDDDEDDEMGEGGKESLKGSVKKESETGGEVEETKTEQNALVDAMMTDVEMKIAAEEAEEEGSETGNREPDDDGSTEENADKVKKPPGPGCGPDGPPGVLVIHRRKGPKKQLRWRAADDLEEIRYFELDVTERCNVTKSFTDMKQLERVDERQNFRMARKVGSEDNMTERTPWRALLVVDNVPPSPDGSQSLERNIQHQRERIVLQALYFNKSMIPDSPFEADPIDTYQTADPVHIPLEDVTGNPDSVNDFTSMPWPDARSTPPHESAAFNSPFFPTDLPPAAGFGPGGFPPPFAAGGPAPWQLPGPPGAAVVGGPRTSLPPGIFSALNQPPPGMPPMVVGSSAATGGAAGGAGGNSPNILNLPLNIPPNVPPPGMFPGAATFNSPPPDIALLEAGGRRGGGDGNFRGGIPPPWISNNRSFGGSGGNHPPRGGGGYGGHRGGGPGGNWNTRNAGNGNRAGDRGRNGDDNRGNYRGPPGTGAPWLQTSRGRGGVGARKW